MTIVAAVPFSLAQTRQNGQGILLATEIMAMAAKPGPGNDLQFNDDEQLNLSCSFCQVQIALWCILE